MNMDFAYLQKIFVFIHRVEEFSWLCFFFLRLCFLLYLERFWDKYEFGIKIAVLTSKCRRKRAVNGGGKRLLNFQKNLNIIKQLPLGEYKAIVQRSPSVTTATETALRCTLLPLQHFLSDCQLKFSVNAFTEPVPFLRILKGSRR